MKLKIASILLLVTLVHKKTNGQDTLRQQLEDTLQSPLFYSIAPKIFEVSTRLSPGYKVNFNNSETENCQYKDEYVTSVNLMLPLVINKEGWSVTSTLDYQNYQYKVEYNNSLQNKNYSIYNYGIRVIKMFDITGRQFILTNTLNAGMSDFVDLQNIRGITSLTTKIKLKNNDVLLVGVIGLFDKEIKIPAIPVVNYSTWISRPCGLLLSFNFPYIDINTTKVFNNRTLLKGGIGLLYNGHYIESGDYSFLMETDDYKLRKIQLTLNTKFERTIYKGVWFGSEMGYAYNYKTGITTKDEYIQLDDSNNSNGLYIKCGLFLRPVTSKWKKN